MVTKKLLNHATGRDVTEGYMDITVERLREPVDRIAAKLLALCDVAPITAKNVAKLKRKKVS
jgi:hypothetical protein